MITIFVFIFPSKACPVPNNIEDLSDILAAFNLSVSFVGTEAPLKPNSSPFCVSPSSPTLIPSASISGIILSKPNGHLRQPPHAFANPHIPTSNATHVIRKPIASPPSAAKPSKNTVDRFSAKPSSSVCIPPLFSKGSSLIVNKNLPYGAILSFHPDGIVDSNAPYNSTDFKYIIEKLSNDEFLIEGGNLPSSSDFSISVPNSTSVYLTSVGSRIEVTGRIPSGALLTYTDGKNETSSVSLLPFLYKVIDCKSTLVTGGNLPQGFIIYFSEK